MNEVIDKPKSRSKKSMKTNDSTSMIRLIAVALVAVLAAMSWYFSWKGPEAVRKVETPAQPVQAPVEATDTNKLKLKIANQICIALEQASMNNKKAYYESMGRIENSLADACTKAIGNITKVTDKLCSFKGCATICYHIAMGDSDQYINDIVKPQITDECLKGAEKAAGELTVFEDTLARNSTEMQVQMVAGTEQILKDANGVDTTAFINLVKDTSNYSQACKDEAISKSFAIAGLGLSACFVKGTCASGMRLLGYIGKRLGVATGASLVAAAADGPLPIGDIAAVIIEVGSISWCAYDIYKAQETLKNEIQPALNRNIAEFKSKMLSESSRNALALMEKYETHNKQTAANLIKSLDKEK